MKGTRRWSVSYSESGRLSLASATPEERSAVIDFEASLAAHPFVGLRHADHAGGIRVARCDVAGRPAWTSILYRADDTGTDEVLIVSLISGP